MLNNKDAIMHKVQAVANKTMSTTQKLANEGGRALAKVELNARVDKLYKQLGELVYMQTKTGTSDDDMLNFYIKEISRINAQLLKLNRR